jgi:PncC family amidohydrolase
VKGIANKVFLALKRRNLTVSFAESMTGGSLLHQMILIPGASDVVKGGIVAYHQSVKTGLLGVSQDIINQFGVVSAKTAIAMAEEIRMRTASDIGISTTGNAGPVLHDGVIKEVYIGMSSVGLTTYKHMVFNQDSTREEVIMTACEEALKWLFEQG